MRVGLFGGSFNPVHEGHLHVAQTAKAALDLDLVIWLVSPQNPLKGLRAAPLEDRISQVKRLADRPGMAVTGVERLLGSAYTVETLRWFVRRWPAVRFFFVMGADNLKGFHRWREWREIPRLAEVVVVPRPGHGAAARASRGANYLASTGRARFLDGPLNALSSTGLREDGMGTFAPEAGRGVT